MRIPVEKRRELLLDSAFHVIARGGVDGATTRAICANAGVTLSTFHYVFESREALLAALVQRGVTVELEAVTEALAEGASVGTRGRTGVEQMLYGALSAYIDGVVADPDREQAMIALNQYARQTDGLREFGAQMYHAYYDAIADGLDAAAALAGMSWTTPVRDLAPLVVAATDGITLSYLNIRDVAVCRTIARATTTLLLTHVTDAIDAGGTHGHQT